MLKIYGNPRSVFSNKVVFLLHYLNIDYEFISVDLLQGEQKLTDFLSLNPAGKVPVLVDGDFKLSESQAIMRYIANKYNSDLYPASLQERAIIDQWLDFTTMHIGGSFIKIVFNKVFYKMLNTEPDLRSLKEGEEWVLRFLPVLEKQLSQNKYTCGERLSLADFSLFPIIKGAQELINYDFSNYPSLSKWFINLKSMNFCEKRNQLIES